jgi:2-haloacid dehalogenase
LTDGLATPRILVISHRTIKGVHVTARSELGVIRSSPRLLTFDFFGTLVETAPAGEAAFARILRWNNASSVSSEAFYKKWLATLQASLLGPYESYRDLSTQALEKVFFEFGIDGRSGDIGTYFDGFPKLKLWPDTERTLALLAERHPIAVITNMDNDVFAVTPKPDIALRYVFTSENARGYKPDGTLFRYALRESGLGPTEVLHSGQSQWTDMVGAKPLGIPVAWINRYALALHPSVPAPDFEFRDLTPLVDIVDVVKDDPAAAPSIQGDRDGHEV